MAPVVPVVPSSPGRQSRAVEKIRQKRMIGFPLNRQYDRQPKLEQQPAIVAPTAPGLVAFRSGSHRTGHRGRHHPCGPRHTRSYGLHQDHRHAGDHRALHPLLTSPDVRPLRLLAAVTTENSVRSENTGVPTIREIIVATTMSSLFVAFFALTASTFRTRAALQAEILALRQQLGVFQKNGPRRLRLHRCDPLLWVLLYRFWSGWRRCLAMVQPDTVIRWHRKAFAWHWTRKSRRLPGRPEVAANIRDLVRRMSQANPLWGAPRIHGELLKLGIAVAQSTVARYLPRPRKPPSQTWRTFLTNHLTQTAAIDFFTVPTATFRVLFVLVVLSHERRRVLHFGVTEHPTEEWTMQQMREAFPWDAAPRYVLRDGDAIYGRDFAAMIRHMGIEEVPTAPRSPWQNPFAERLVGSIRRECLDHVIVWNERSLRRTLHNYFAYYQSYAFSLGQRRPGVQGSGTTGTGACGSDSTGRGITPPISTTRRLAGASRLPRRLPSGVEMPLLLDLAEQNFC